MIWLRFCFSCWWPFGRTYINFHCVWSTKRLSLQSKQHLFKHYQTNFSTVKRAKLPWRISSSQHVNLTKDLSLDFISAYISILLDPRKVVSGLQEVELKELTLKCFKICTALKTIDSFVSWKLSSLNYRPSLRPRPDLLYPSRLPIFLETRRHGASCTGAGREIKTFIACSLCNVALFVQKEKNCFLKYHS